MEFNSGNSSLPSTSHQIQNEIGFGDVNFNETSEMTSPTIHRNSSSENVVSSSIGDIYGNSSTNFDEKDSLLKSTKLFLGGEWIEIPNILINDEPTFRSVINKESFQSLSQAAKSHLNRYLPESDGTCLDEVLFCTFSNDKNFFFGNPMEKFFKKISGNLSNYLLFQFSILDGYFNSVDHVQLRDHKRVLYDHYIRHYQMNLLKKLLVSRHALLETASKQKGSLGEHSKDSLASSSIKHLLGELKPQSSTKLVPNKLNYSTRRLAKHSNVRRRAKIRARL
uniref:RGS domain-containing protein n=1 Tax=Meloidogyne hapla TaxID=6305 RepID=A0A1I8B0U8_MELHA